MRVVVRADSWHYKVWKWAQDPFVIFDRWTEPTADQLKNRAKEPTALCGYFWTIVLVPLMFPFALLFMGALMGALGVVVGVCWLGLLGVDGIRRLWRTARRQEKVAKPTSLVVAVVAAKKRSICPLIEVER